MVIWIFGGTRGAGRAGLRAAVIASAAIIAGALAGEASAATVPRPAPGVAAGASTIDSDQGDVIRIFYQQVNHSLVMVSGPWASEWNKTVYLGGRLTSGPAAITISGGSARLTSTWVFARGADKAVHYRQYAEARGSWGPWTRLGGLTVVGTPGVTCLRGQGDRPVVFVRGTHGALWQRSLKGGGWISRGGHIVSAPAALPDVAGNCTGRLDVFALGTDHAVWEFTGAWHRVGGRSSRAPAVARRPNGETDLFIRGADGALWMNVRAPGAAAWRGWHRIGGFLTSPPTAVLWPYSILGKARAVLALGRDGNLRIAQNFVGTSRWTWAPVP